MEIVYCDCGRQLDQQWYYSLPNGAPNFLKVTCEQCRSKHYMQERTFISWDGFPGGSEGLLLAYILSCFESAGYTDTDVTCIWMNNKAYQWVPEAFNFVYRNECGPAAILQLDRIVMSDGTWFEAEVTDDEYNTTMLVHRAPVPPTPPTLMETLTDVFNQDYMLKDFDYDKFQKYK